MVQAVEIGERLRVRLDGWGRLGEGLGQHEGVPVFVFGGIDGEEVEAEGGAATQAVSGGAGGAGH